MRLTIDDVLEVIGRVVPILMFRRARVDTIVFPKGREDVCAVKCHVGDNKLYRFLGLGPSSYDIIYVIKKCIDEFKYVKIGRNRDIHGFMEIKEFFMDSDKKLVIKVIQVRGRGYEGEHLSYCVRFNENLSIAKRVIILTQER